MYSTRFALTPANPELQALPGQIRAHLHGFLLACSRCRSSSAAPGARPTMRLTRTWSSSSQRAQRQTVRRRQQRRQDRSISTTTITASSASWRRWDPMPRFYDLNNDNYGKTRRRVSCRSPRAIDGQMPSLGQQQLHRRHRRRAGRGCCTPTASGCSSGPSCRRAADAERYRAFLNNYAAEQQRCGRFHWPAHTQLRDVREWLIYEHVVTDEARILVLVSLQLPAGLPAQCHGADAGEVHGPRGRYRRAPRARAPTARAIFAQCLIEAGVVGLAGGLLGAGADRAGTDGPARVAVRRRIA